MLGMSGKGPRILVLPASGAGVAGDAARKQVSPAVPGMMDFAVWELTALQLLPAYAAPHCTLALHASVVITFGRQQLTRGYD